RAAPADRADARRRERPHASHGDQHRHHCGHRSRRASAGASAPVHRRPARGERAGLCRGDALRGLARLACSPALPRGPHRGYADRSREGQPVESVGFMLSFQQLILRLNEFWDRQGCVLLQPYDMEMGAGTFHTATFLRAVGPEPWNAAYVQPSRRPKDGRYGENPNRLQHYYQFQVILKPSPEDIQELYLQSLYAIGIDPKLHDIRFVEDDWESPTLGAWGLGWECWCDGMEVSQFTYFQQVAGFECAPVSGELTYGLERLAMYVQGVENVFELNFNGRDGAKKVSYGDVFLQAEQEYSRHNFEFADTEMLFEQFRMAEAACRKYLEAGWDGEDQGASNRAGHRMALPAYDQCIKASHIFNLLDARGVISVTERQSYILRVRELAKACGKAWLATEGGGTSAAGA